MGTIILFTALKGQFNKTSDVAIIIKIVRTPHFSYQGLRSANKK
jgi:hypothetical protein